MGCGWQFHPARRKSVGAYITNNQKARVSPSPEDMTTDSKAGMTALRLLPITDRCESRHCARSRLCCERPLLSPRSHYFAKPLVAAYGQGARNLLRFVYFRDTAYVTRQGMRERDHDIQGSSLVPRQVCKKTWQRLLRLSSGSGCLLRARRHESDEGLCWHRRARRCRRGLLSGGFAKQPMREAIQKSLKRSFDSSIIMVPNRWRPSIASSAARMRKALTTQKAKNVCSVRSGHTVIDGAARSCSETSRGKRFDPRAAAFLTRLVPTVVMQSLRQDAFWTKRSHVALRGGAKPVAGFHAIVITYATEGNSDKEIS